MADSKWFSEHPVLNSPEYCINLALFTDVANSNELRRLIVEGAFEAALLNACMIADPFQVIVASHKALQLYKQEKMKTRNLHSEVVFNLSSSNNISDSFKKFGISDDTRDVLVALITSEDAHEKMSQIKKLVKGSPKTFSSLKAITDQDKIKKVYKLTDAELQLGSLSDAVVTRMATKDAS